MATVPNKLIAPYMQNPIIKPSTDMYICAKYMMRTEIREDRIENAKGVA